MADILQANFVKFISFFQDRCILIQISLKYITNDPINRIGSDNVLHRSGFKLLSEPMM